jgi:hypothetical protein
MSPLENFQIYCSIKCHFNQKSYDYTKYGLNQRRFNEGVFRKRRDAYYFQKLANKIPNKKAAELFYASNLAYDTDTWIGDLANNQIHIDQYNRARSTISAIEYKSLEDLKKGISVAGSVKELFFTGDMPQVYKLLIAGDINPESVVLFKRILDFDNRYRDIIDSYNPLYTQIEQRINKYSSFVVLQDAATLKRVRDGFCNIIRSSKDENSN